MKVIRIGYSRFDATNLTSKQIADIICALSDLRMINDTCEQINGEWVKVMYYESDETNVSLQTVDPKQPVAPTYKIAQAALKQLKEQEEAKATTD
jgi:hypothetical protein